jgi:hypothetical protein
LLALAVIAAVILGISRLFNGAKFSLGSGHSAQRLFGRAYPQPQEPVRYYIPD